MTLLELAGILIVCILMAIAQKPCLWNIVKHKWCPRKKVCLKCGIIRDRVRK